MKKKANRLLSFLLVLVLVFTVLPFDGSTATVQAAGEEPTFYITGHKLKKTVSLKGREATIKNSEGIVVASNVVIGENGAVNQELEAGTYTVEVDGYLPGEITVGADGNIANASLVLEYKVFADTYCGGTDANWTLNNGHWNLSSQNDGLVKLTNQQDGFSLLTFTDKMTDMNLTLQKVRAVSQAHDGASTDLRFDFTNGKGISFRLVNENGTIIIQSMDVGLHNWNKWGELTEAEKTQYFGDGVAFRVVRQGVAFTLYIGERQVTAIDLSEHVSVETEMYVTIRHFGDSGQAMDIPFDLYTESYPVSFNVQGKKFQKIMSLAGQTVEITDGIHTETATIGEEGRISANLFPGTYTIRVDGYMPEKITVDGDGNVDNTSFTLGYKVFADTVLGTDEKNETLTHWDLTNQNEGSITLKKDSDFSRLTFTDAMTDMDLVLKITEKTPVASDEIGPATGIRLDFENGKGANFRVFYNGGEGYIVQGMKEVKDGDNITGWEIYGNLTANEIKQFQEGRLEFRVIRSGTDLYVCIGGREIKKFDLSEHGITKDTKMYTTIRRWGNLKQDIEIPFTLSERVSYISEDRWMNIAESNDSKYAVLTGTFKKSGDYVNAWPSINVRLTEQGESWADAFQFLYNSGHGYSIKSNEQNVPDEGKWVDHIHLKRETDVKGRLTNPLDSLISDDGLQFKVVRLENWVYVLVKTGDAYELLHRMPLVDGDAPTCFSWRSVDITNTRLVAAETSYGKEVALAALNDASYTLVPATYTDEDGNTKVNPVSQEDSLYIPVDSMHWTLTAKVSLKNYQALMDGYVQGENEPRAIHVGPGSAKNHYNRSAWDMGQGIVYRGVNDDGTGDAAWKIQNLEKWYDPYTIPDEISKNMQADAGGMWIRFVRDGSKLASYVSADGSDWKFATSRADLPMTEEGFYIDTANEVTFTNMKITVEYGNMQGMSMKLSDSIDLIYYMDLDPAITASDTAYMKFEIDGCASKNAKAEPIYLKDALKQTVNGKEYYAFVCSIAAKEMSRDIKLHLYDQDADGNDMEKDKYTYSVQSYARQILTREEYTNGHESLRTMIKAMLNYGTSAQDYFAFPSTDDSGNAVERANAIAEMNDADRTLGEVTIHMEAVNYPAITGIKWYGTSLMTTSRTAIRHYFTLEEGTELESFTFTYQGKTLNPQAKGASYYYVEIPGIAAGKLSENYELTVACEGASGVLTYSPYQYIKAVLDNETYGVHAQNMVKALYHYSEAAKVYAGSAL